MTRRKSAVLALFLIGLGLGYYLYRFYGLRSLPGMVKTGEILYEQEYEQSKNGVEAVNYRVEEVARGLKVPWSIAFTSPDRMLVTEREGKIRVVENGVLIERPLVVFEEVSSVSEEGLMGMALHPNYAKNKYIYVSLAYEETGGLRLKVLRLIDEGSSAKLDKVLLDKIPAARLHAGSRIKFGPDAKLYVTVGDATDRELAQNKDSLAGKILRMNDDGSIPSDNPFPGSYVYSLGHRNPQGIDWQPITNRMFSVEHGPSGFDGPGGGDELNLIEAGKNYGWPRVSHVKSLEGMVSPLITWTPAVAPAGLLIYRGQMFPQFKGDVFFGGLRGEGLFRVVLGNGGAKVVRWEKVSGINIGRIREVVEGPDEAIYFSTSNQDGRGQVREGDDKIYRLIAN